MSTSPNRTAAVSPAPPIQVEGFNLNEAVLQPADYKDRDWYQAYSDIGYGLRIHDVLWPRSNMFGAAAVMSGIAGINDFDCMYLRWEWNWPATGVHSRKLVRGKTVDANGNAIGSVSVSLFNTSTGKIVDTQTSFADGSYTVGDPNAVNCFAVGYLAGSPDTEGTTVNTITGS